MAKRVARPVGLQEEAGLPAISYSFIQHIFIEAPLRARHRLDAGAAAGGVGESKTISSHKRDR